MSRKIDAETREQIVKMYLDNPNMRYLDISKCLRVSEATVGNIIRAELKAWNGIKPDRRAKPEPPDWMAYVTPLNARKRELEEKVKHKQAELEAARQELRDFTATLRQLMEDTI